MGVPIRGSVPAFVAFACLATGAVLAGDVGNALLALESSQPAQAAQLAPAWREALARMSAAQLPRIKWLLRHISVEDARALVAETRSLNASRLIRARVAQRLEELGAGEIIP